MNTEAATRIHHPYSPSKLQCLEACPVYESAFTDSEAARTGTMQHDVADSGEDDARLADYRAEAVVECVKFVDELAESMGPGVIRINEEYLPIDGEVLRVRVDKSEVVDGKTVSHQAWKNFSGTTAGYLDVGLLSASGQRAKVIDYKFGQVAVEDASNNLQGISYMLGLAKRYPSIEECDVYFLMPHRDAISFHTFKRAEFPALHLRIKTVVARAVVANKVDGGDFDMATPTEGSCLFCSRLGRCPKVAELALAVGKKYAPLKVPASVSTAIFTDPVDTALGIKVAQVLKQWAESFRAQATAKTIDDPTFIPAGYKLVQMSKRAVRKAKALAEFAKTFLPVEMHPKVEELYDIPLGKLEELIKISSPRGSKEATVEDFGEKAVAAGLLEQGEPYAFLRQDNAKK